VAVGVFMATLDGSIVNVALPAMGADLGASIRGVGAVVAVYLLVVSAALLAAGRLGDLLGFRRVYAGGMLLFTLGSGLAGLSRSLAPLVAARAVQALGAAAMMAVSPAILTAIFPREERGRALGAMSTVVAAGLTAGPPVGGILLQAFSWPAIFLVNLPVGVAGAIWVSRTLPGGAEDRGAAFDAPGAAWLALAVGGGVAAVEAAPASGAAALALLALAAWAVAGLARREARAPSPLLDGALLRDRTFALGLAAGLLSYAALFTQTLLSPFYLAQVKGLGPGTLGAMLTVVPVALAVASPVAGWISDRAGPAIPCVAGALLLAGGLLSLAAAGDGDSLPSLAARLAAEGLGMGLFQPANNSAVMGALPRERLGTGGGMLATARNLGMVLGVAAGGALLALGSGGGTAPEDFLRGWRLALGAGAALALGSAALSAVRPARARRA
jgi:EmrB/QacA subfamily drug resistance transporter